MNAINQTTRHDGYSADYAVQRELGGLARGAQRPNWQSSLAAHGGLQQGAD